MARRAQPVGSAPGWIAAGIVVAIMAGALVAVASRADIASGFGPGDWAAIRFTVLQAALSAVFSVALAVPVGRALARRRFVGRRALITLLGAPFILPVIVAVLGLIGIFGRNGWLNQLLGLAGLPPLQVYGLHGVVLAHVFFNLPLATRLILQGWQQVPAERFRLAAQLSMGPGAIWRLIERPMLVQVLPGAAAIVFAICLTSFAVALTLGGGPRATTIELAIYQAFRFDFDLSRAALLALVQIVLTLGAAALAFGAVRGMGFGAGLDRPVQRWDAAGAGLRVQDAGAILLAAAFLILPLLTIVADGVPGLAELPGSVWRAALVSIAVALGSMCVMLALAVPLSIAASQGRGSLLELAGLLGMAVSPLVIGTGLFLILNPVANPAALAFPVTALVNALMAVPFALRVLVPAVRDVIGDHGRLGLSLGMAGWPFLRHVLIPRMRPALGFSAGLAAALSMGDLGVVALFADPQHATLPLQIYRLMGSFRTEAAASGALILLVLSVGVFWLFDRGGGRDAGA